MRMLKTIALSLTLLAPVTALAGQATLYKGPQCGCCESHAEHLRQNGLSVTSVVTHDLAHLRQQHGVPADLVGYHMLLIDGYLVEGHVSAVTVKRLLAERPAVKGIAMPGMPTGVPGMPGPKDGPIEVFAFGAGAPTVYVRE